MFYQTEHVSKDEGLVTDTVGVITCLPQLDAKRPAIWKEKKRQLMPRAPGSCEDKGPTALTVSGAPDLLLRESHSQGELGLWGIWMSRWHFGLLFTVFITLLSFQECADH